MIIRFLKSNNPAALFVLPLIAIAIWSFSLALPAPEPFKHAMPFYEFIGLPLASIPWLGRLVGLLLVVGGAFLINYIVNENEILAKKSYLPALFYIVFMSNNSVMLNLHPLLFANIFILFAFNKILSSYRKDVAFSQVFDAGLLISVATLFYFPCIVFFPVIAVALVMFRTFNWREWMISFIGAFVPYALVITGYFWKGTLDYLFYDKMFFPIVLEKPAVELSQSFYFLLSVGWIIVIFSFGKLFSGISTGSQKAKKAMILMLWMFVFSILSVFLAPEISTKYFSLLVIPTSVICSNYFLRQKKELWGEIIFIIFFVAIFVNLIGNIF